MYLHIGNRKSVKKDRIIGIFDLDTSTVSRTGREFINEMEKSGLVEYGDSDLPRSFILTEDGGKYKVLLSRISTAGLRARCDMKYGDDEE